MKPLVFVDSSTVLGNAYDFGGARLRSLRQLGASGAIELVTTDITIKEIEKHILADLADLREAVLGKIKSKGRPLNALTESKLVPIRDEAHWDLAREEAVTKVKTYFSEPPFTIIKASTRSGAKVFEQYFAQSPPFGAPGKTKEFPDAFVLDALEEVAVARGTPVLLVAADPDFAARAVAHPESFTHYGDLADALNALNGTEEVQVAHLERQLQRNRPQLREAIRGALETAAFHCIDEDLSIDTVEIEKLRLGRHNILALGDKGGVVEYKVKVRARLEGAMPDPNSYFHDPEDGGFYFHTLTFDDTRAFEVPVVVEIGLKTDGPDNGEGDHPHLSVEGIDLHDRKALGFFLDPDAATNWK